MKTPNLNFEWEHCDSHIRWQKWPNKITDSAYYGCSKNFFVSFLLYVDLVFCFIAPEKQYSGTV